MYQKKSKIVALITLISFLLTACATTQHHSRPTNSHESTPSAKTEAAIEKTAETTLGVALGIALGLRLFMLTF